MCHFIPFSSQILLHHIGSQHPPRKVLLPCSEPVLSSFGPNHNTVSMLFPALHHSPIYNSSLHHFHHSWNDQLISINLQFPYTITTPLVKPMDAPHFSANGHHFPQFDLATPSSPNPVWSPIGPLILLAQRPYQPICYVTPVWQYPQPTHIISRFFYSD